MRITCSPSWNPTFSNAGIRATASGRGASLGGAFAGGKVSPPDEEAAGGAGGVGGKA